MGPDWAGVTDATWQETGQPKLLEALKEFRASGNSRGLARLLYGACYLVVQGTLQPATVVDALASAGWGGEGMDDAEEVLMDVLSLLELETEGKGQQLVETLGRQMLVRKVVRVEPAMRVLEPGFLAPLPGNANNRPTHTVDFQKAITRARTKQQYRQSKYNLLREAPEGYAKLVTLVAQDVGLDQGQATYDSLLAFMGYFELDPNRVADIILDVFEAKMAYGEGSAERARLAQRERRSSHYVDLLARLQPRKGALARLLHFKLAHYQAAGGAVPQAFFRVVAALVGADMVELEDIMPNLQPSMAEMVAEDRQMRQAVAKAASSIQKTGTLRSDETDQRSMEDVKRDIRAEHLRAMAVRAEGLGSNQKVQLGLALLEQHNWAAAQRLAAMLPQWLLPTYPPCTRALCNTLHALIEPIYRKKAGRGSTPPEIQTQLDVIRRRSKGMVVCEQLADLQKTVFPMVLLLGAYVHIDPVLVGKLARLGREAVRDKGLVAGYVDVLGGALLPALVLLPCNPNMVEELWGAIALLPWRQRYLLYALWKNYAFEEPPKALSFFAGDVASTALVHPLLPVERAMATVLVSAKFKRVTAEDVKGAAKFLCKLTHSNPGAVFDYLCYTVANFDNWIQVLVDAFRLLANMARDVFVFCLVEAMAKLGTTYKDNPFRRSQLQKSMAVLAATFLRRYPNVETAGLLTYVCARIGEGSQEELVVLREMITKMAGLEVTENMGPDMLDAMAGGPALRAQASYVQAGNLDRATAQLQDALAPMAVPALLALAQTRARRTYPKDQFAAKDVVACSSTLDECQEAFMQLAEFVRLHTKSETYEAMLPDMQQLLEDYGLTDDAAFHLSRPVFARKIKERDIVLSTDAKGPTMKTEAYAQAVADIMGPITDLVAMRPGQWDLVTPRLFTTCWSLAMYDLHCPKERYEAGLQRLKAELDALAQDQDGGRKQREAKATYDALKAEMVEHEEHQKRVMGRLRKEAPTWFTDSVIQDGRAMEAASAFVELCVGPRRMFSPLDSAYAAEFVRTMHALRTPGFSTVCFLYQLFRDVRPSLVYFTDPEAKRYGRFLGAMLGMATSWYTSETLYNAEVAGTPGSVVPQRLVKKDAVGTVQAGHSDYMRLFRLWHNKILYPHISASLEAKESYVVRNTLLVLKEIAEYFPLNERMASSMDAKVSALQDQELVKATAQSLLAYLKKYRTMPGHYILKGDIPPPSRSQSISGPAAPTANGAKPPGSEAGEGGPGTPQEQPDRQQKNSDRPASRTDDRPPPQDRAPSRDPDRSHEPSRQDRGSAPDQHRGELAPHGDDRPSSRSPGRSPRMDPDGSRTPYGDQGNGGDRDEQKPARKAEPPEMDHDRDAKRRRVEKADHGKGELKDKPDREEKRSKRKERIGEDKEEDREPKRKREDDDPDLDRASRKSADDSERKGQGKARGSRSNSTAPTPPPPSRDREGRKENDREARKEAEREARRDMGDRDSRQREVERGEERLRSKEPKAQREDREPKMQREDREPKGQREDRRDRDRSSSAARPRTGRH
eukprot:comp24170_c0_seq2/m.44104 comp24170_c0_seq2/g.44104  ORF comp24170_c0_seq2/g.44104 comp24170_c0_seq2/m.44104 type:complete len:1533 (-) comp24170_c0_seq2:62-4660(-)